MTELPSGTVTFLLTDVEGSVRLWAQDRDAMARACSRHDRIIDDCVAEHQGVVVRPRGEGDSRFAVFHRAGDAVVAALTIQQDLLNEEWPTPWPVRVRIGVHTGETISREGDYYGSTVNRCARLRNIGHGGQVLLSEATAVLARDDLPPDVHLRDLGAHGLRGLERPERVWQLLHPTLPSEFPPLASLNARPYNLPIPPTSLVGRDHDMAELRVLLSRGDVRLVTLTGPGGVGKTRLGLQLACELFDQFKDGAICASLASTTDASLVASTIAQALDVRDVAGESIVASIKNAMLDKHLLLVLDDFEPFSGAMSLLVADLLATCPQIKLLLTGRTPLHVRGEHEAAVRPLELPRPEHLLSLNDIARIPAVALFIERARDVRPDFVVTRENATAVAEICRRLDGLPLAIELAAARAKFLAPTDLLGRLSHRLEVLTDGRRDLPARQQTMRDTIAWSYGQLSEQARVLFRRLSIFAGGCTLDGMKRVCLVAHDAEQDLLNSLQLLVDNSLVQQATSVGGEQRFRMLETIREFALECLDQSGELRTLQEAHIAHYLALAEEAEAGLRGPEQAAWLRLLASEHENVLAILGWTLTDRRYSTGLRLASSIWRSWPRHGHVSDGRAWLEAALLHRAGVEREVRAKALIGAGELACALGDVRRARDWCQESLALCEDLGDVAGKAASLHILGWSIASCAESEDDYHLARTHQEACLALQREVGDRLGEAKALHESGELARYLGEYDLATSRLEQALSMRRNLDDAEGVGWSLHCLAWTAYDQGQHDQAMRIAREALTLWQKLDHELGYSASRGLRARIAWRQGDCVRAARELEASLRLWPKLQHREWLGFDCQVLAALVLMRYSDRRGAQRAARLLAAADTLRGGIPLPLHRRQEINELRSSINRYLDSDTVNAAQAKGRSFSADRVAQYAYVIVAGWCRREGDI